MHFSSFILCVSFWRGKVVLNKGLLLRAESLGESLILISLRDNASKLFLIENNLGAFLFCITYEDVSYPGR